VTNPDSPVLLSCIIPLYNVVDFIEELACSLFDQPRDWIEYIFVDDCSIDGSGEYLAKVIGRYEATNTHIISLEVNQGPSAARNAGLEVARGEYVWCLDSDDLVNRAAWTMIKSLLERGDLDVVILDFLYSQITIQNKLVWTSQPNNRRQTGAVLDFVEERILCTRKPEKRTMAGGRVLQRKDGVIGALMRDQKFFTWSVIVRRALYEDVRFPVGKLIEDVSTLPKLFFKAKYFYFLSMPVVYYRQWENSLLASGKRALYTDMCGSMTYIKDYISKHNIEVSAVEKLEMDTFHLQTLVWAAVDFKRTGLMHDREAVAILKSNIRQFKMTSEMSGKMAIANMKAIGRTADYLLGRLVLLHLELYFRLSLLFGLMGRGRQVIRMLLLNKSSGGGHV